VQGVALLPRDNDKSKAVKSAPRDSLKSARDAQEEIAFLRQKFSSMVMRGHYKECFKLIEENLKLLYFRERWPENFYSTLKIHKKCYPAMDITQPYDEYLPTLLKKNGITTVFIQLLRGSGSFIDWSAEYFRDLALVAENKEAYDEALGYCELYIKMDPTSSNAYLLKGWILNSAKQEADAVEAFKLSLEYNGANFQALRCLAEHYIETSAGTALEYIERAAELAPGDPRIFATMAKIQLKMGRRAEALASYERAGHLDPLDPQHPYLRGELLLADGQRLGALRMYGQAVGIDEKHVPSLMRLATLTAQDQPDLALPYVNTVCSLQPANLKAAVLRGNLLRGTGDESLAIKQFQQVMALDPNNLDALRGLAELYLPKDPGRALSYYDQAITQDQGNARLHLGRARALEKKGDEGAAIAAYKVTVGLDKTIGEAWGSMGLMLVETKPVPAADYLGRAISLIPNNPYYHHGRGRALLKTGARVSEAIECFHNAVKYDPGNAQYHLHLAQLLEQINNTTSAVEHYRSAVSLDTSCTPAYYGLAKLLQHSQPDAAITYINSAISLHGTNGEYYYLKAKILDELGQRGDSLFNLKKSLTQDTQNTETMQELSEILSGESPRVALMYINRAIELSPQNSRYVCTRANILYNVGSMAKALSQYEAALKLDPKNHEALFGIGRIMTEKSDRKGLEYLDKAISLAPNAPHYYACKAELLGKTAETYKQALDCYDTAFSLDKQRWDILLAKAKLQQEHGDLADAQNNYRRVLLLNRDCLDATARMGGLLAERGVPAGLSYLDHAIRLDDQTPGHHVCRARLLYTMDRPEEAEEECRIALNLGADDTGIYHTLARALSKRLPETALKHVTSAIEMAPDNAANHLLKGDIHALLEEYPEAAEAYEKAQELDPDCHEAMAKRAAILYPQGHPDSLPLIERALALCPKNANYLYIKAGILHDLRGDTPQAVSCLTQAVKLDPNDVESREMLVAMLTESKNRLRVMVERRGLDKARRRREAQEALLRAAGELPPEPEKDEAPATEQAAE